MAAGATGRLIAAGRAGLSAAASTVRGFDAFTACGRSMALRGIGGRSVAGAGAERRAASCGGGASARGATAALASTTRGAAAVTVGAMSRTASVTRGAGAAGSSSP